MAGSVDPGPTLSARLMAEELRQSPQVSGVRLLGYAGLPASRGGDRPEFVVQVPLDWPGGPVCLRVQSADALYEATAQVDLPADRAGGVAAIAYSSDYLATFWQARAVDLGDDGLAALLSEGPCATAAPGMARVLPLLGPAEAGAAQSLLVNTFGGEGGFAAVTGTADTTPCEPILASVQTSYDMRCRIALPPGTEGPVQVTVWPIKGGELGLPIEVSLWAPR